MANLLSLTQLMNSHLYSNQRKCGTIVDFYIHDKSWVVEYIIIQVGVLFTSKQVLFPPGLILTVDPKNKSLTTGASPSEVKNLPNASDIITVSQMLGFHTHHSGQWAYYWRMRNSPEQKSVSQMLAREEWAIKNALSDESFQGTHLRNYTELLVYSVMDSLNHGHLKDILVNKNSWQAVKLISENGWPWNRKREIIDSSCISEVKWKRKEIKIKTRCY